MVKVAVTPHRRGEKFFLSPLLTKLLAGSFNFCLASISFCSSVSGFFFFSFSNLSTSSWAVLLASSKNLRFVFRPVTCAFIGNTHDVSCLHVGHLPYALNATTGMSCVSRSFFSWHTSES